MRVRAQYKKLIRNETRLQIAESRSHNAVKIPVSLACVHLHSDGNLGFMIRSAACFGATEVLVIGSLPHPRDLRQLSCGLDKFIDIKTFKNPGEFLAYTRENDIHVVSLEICEKAIDIREYKFPKDRKICIITGNESTGVPGEIIMNSDCVKIPNPGIGSCLNTSQASNIILFDCWRQLQETY